MSGLTSVIGRFAAQELAIRRLYAADPEFRVLCEDFQAAERALEHWKADDAKGEEYRRLVQELEEEILEFLEAQLRRCGVKARL